MKRPTNRLRWVLLALVSVAASGSSPDAQPRQAPEGDVERSSPAEIHEIHVDVSGVRIRALCTEGRPDVFLLHGDGASADTWIPVLERLDGSVGACAYDRRGSGRNDERAPARGWYELMDELRRIHLALGADRGYLLVGHGLGGLYARVYAADRPRDVAGLVLVEPAHEDMPRHVRVGIPSDEWESWTRARREPNADGVTEADVGERARRSRLPAIPVTVLTATRRPDGDGWNARFVNEAARQVHASILRGVLSGRHIPASRSGPAIQRDQPRLVVAEIERIVHSMRFAPR